MKYILLWVAHITITAADGDRTYITVPTLKSFHVEVDAWIVFI